MTSLTSSVPVGRIAQPGESSFPSSSLRRRSPLQIPTKVIDWLHRCYIAEDRCQVPKAALYDAYEEFCRSEKLRPKPPNVFGKIIKQVYPHVGTSRMGSHLHQVPYYTGIAPRVHPPGSNEAKPLTTRASSSSPSSSSPSSASSSPLSSPNRSRSPSPTLIRPSAPPKISRSTRMPQPAATKPTTTPSKGLPSSLVIPTATYPHHHSNQRSSVIVPTPHPAVPMHMGGLPFPLGALPPATQMPPGSVLPYPFPSMPSPIRQQQQQQPQQFPSLLHAPPNNHLPPFMPPRQPVDTTPKKPMTEEDRMLQSIKEKFLSYTQPVHVK